MDRRNFLRTMIGGVATAAAVRAFPFRVYSFPQEIARPTPEQLKLFFSPMPGDYFPFGDVRYLELFRADDGRPGYVDSIGRFVYFKPVYFKPALSPARADLSRT